MPGLAMGIDVGGTKLEALVLDAHGRERWRQRVATPAGNYAATVAAIAALADAGRSACGTRDLSIGLGTPGALTAAGVMKNCNSNCLNGQPLQRDLQAALGQPVALANDANCLALSEATDGAGAAVTKTGVVFAAILGTGVGAGIAVGGQVLAGPNRLAGEWGHNPLPWALPDDPLPLCYCGQRGCIENALCGPAMAADHLARQGRVLTAKDIAERAATDAACAESMARWHNRLARALAHVVNLLDPDVIVLGGGLSRIASTYAVLPALLPRWVFCGGAQDVVLTRVAAAMHGDSSGVRGAAWLGRQAALAGA